MCAQYCDLDLLSMHRGLVINTIRMWWHKIETWCSYLSTRAGVYLDIQCRYRSMCANIHHSNLQVKVGIHLWVYFMWGVLFTAKVHNCGFKLKVWNYCLKHL